MARCWTLSVPFIRAAFAERQEITSPLINDSLGLSKSRRCVIQALPPPPTAAAAGSAQCMSNILLRRVRACAYIKPNLLPSDVRSRRGHELSPRPSYAVFVIFMGRKK